MASKQANKEEVTDTKVPVVSGKAPTGFKVKRVLTMPSLVMKKEGEERVLRFDGPIHTSDVPGKVDPKTGIAEKPAEVADVTDMTTGEQMRFLVPSVVLGNLIKAYPEHGYVGLVFYIKQMGKDPGKRYVNFNVFEVEPEAA